MYTDNNVYEYVRSPLHSPSGAGYTRASPPLPIYSEIYETEDLYSQSYHLHRSSQPLYYNDVSNDAPEMQRDEHIYQSVMEYEEGTAGRQQPLDKRECCLQELLETEKGYVNNALKKIIENFKNKLTCIDEHERNIIFFKLDDLRDRHNSLLQALTEARSHPFAQSVDKDSSRISAYTRAVANVFNQHQEQLLIYGEYCAHFQTALNALDSICATKPTIKEKIKGLEAEMTVEKHQLRDLLFVPVQRILKYHLLLGELFKHTPKDDAAHEPVEEAYERMRDLAEYANEYKRDKETLKIIEDVQNSIVDLPAELTHIKNLGRMRLDGEIKVESQSERSKQR
ncbi:Dbl (DH) domain [Trinorchestia longiramus]|nr:Dbl (DH) domain [Trinorchestia longiramus]